MGLIDDLARLDQAVLPRLARGLHRIREVLRRWRIRPLTAVAALLVLAVAATLVWRLGEPSPTSGNGPFVRVGASDGMLIAPYITQQRIELERLLAGPEASDPVYALVSLKAYLDAEQVTALVATAGPQLEPVAAYARVPLPARQTEIIRLGSHRLPDDLYAAMATAAAHKAADARRQRELAATTDSVEAQAMHRSLAQVDEAEAAAYGDRRCGCVFALLVRGAPAVLARLGAAGAVRVVDAAPEVVSLANTTFVGLLPEQAGSVRPPQDDALGPTPSPS